MSEPSLRHLHRNCHYIFYCLSYVDVSDFFLQIHIKLVLGKDTYFITPNRTAIRLRIEANNLMCVRDCHAKYFLYSVVKIVLNILQSLSQFSSPSKICHYTIKKNIYLHISHKKQPLDSFRNQAVNFHYSNNWYFIIQ